MSRSFTCGKDRNDESSTATTKSPMPTRSGQTQLHRDPCTARTLAPDASPPVTKSGNGLLAPTPVARRTTGVIERRTDTDAFAVVQGCTGPFAAHAIEMVAEADVRGSEGAAQGGGESGGADGAIDDKAGTIYAIDPNVSEPVTGGAVSPRVRELIPDLQQYWVPRRTRGYDNIRKNMHSYRFSRGGAADAGRRGRIDRQPPALDHSLDLQQRVPDDYEREGLDR